MFGFLLLEVGPAEGGEASPRSYAKHLLTCLTRLASSELDSADLEVSPLPLAGCCWLAGFAIILSA